jgi:hypothetical protein
MLQIFFIRAYPLDTQSSACCRSVSASLTPSGREIRAMANARTRKAVGHEHLGSGEVEIETT